MKEPKLKVDTNLNQWDLFQPGQWVVFYTDPDGETTVYAVGNTEEEAINIARGKVMNINAKVGRIIE